MRLPRTTRITRWAGRVWAWDARRRGYRLISGVKPSPGLIGRIRDLVARIKAEEGYR